MKLIVACGGTGGHITPGLAIADIVTANLPGSRVLFIGGNGMEKKRVPEAGYPIKALTLSGVSGKSPVAKMRALLQAMRGEREAAHILSDFGPDLVVGTGGYACFPALRAAVRAGIPTAVHESNAMPGLAVRALASKVDRVWLNFEAAAAQLPRGADVRVVGNPLPKGAGAATAEKRQSNRVLSFGGSLGAAALNRAVLALMRAEVGKDVFHLHATGEREYASFMAAFYAAGLQEGEKCRIVPYLSDMPRQMAKAAVVICRAGAMSISELAAAGCPAVLIPSPNVAGDHQYKNAAALAERGAAVLLPEARMEAELTGTVFALLGDEPRRTALGAAIRSFARPDANKRILEDILALTRADRK